MKKALLVLRISDGKRGACQIMEPYKGQYTMVELMAEA